VYFLRKQIGQERRKSKGNPLTLSISRFGEGRDVDVGDCINEGRGEGGARV